MVDLEGFEHHILTQSLICENQDLIIQDLIIQTLFSVMLTFSSYNQSFGVPKLILSSAAGMQAYAGKWFGTSDIMMKS